MTTVGGSMGECRTVCTIMKRKMYAPNAWQSLRERISRDIRHVLYATLDVKKKNRSIIVQMHPPFTSF